MGSIKEVIRRIEAEWNIESGFFGKLRRGVYDPPGYARVKEILAGIDLGKSLVVDRRLVSLLWYLPLFMLWQHERVSEKGESISELRSATDAVEAEIERILGVP